MKKILLTLIASAVFTLSVTFSALAGCWCDDGTGDLYPREGSWQKDQTGSWYKYEDGTYPANTWLWIQQGKDNRYKHYYFDQNGYLLKNSVAPDGTSVNENGEQILNNNSRNGYMRADINSSGITYAFNYGYMPTRKLSAGSMGYGEQSLCNIALDLLCHSRLESMFKYESFTTSYKISTTERPGQFVRVSTDYKDIPYCVIYQADSRFEDPTGKLNDFPYSLYYNGKHFKEVFQGFPSANDGLTCASLLQQQGYPILTSEKGRVDFIAGNYVISVYYNSDGTTTGTIMLKSKYDGGFWEVY